MAFKNDDEWKKRLTEEQFRVTRQGGTEAAFTGAYWDEKRPGVYRCVCCDAELFRSDDKYDSGSGWPSFTKAASREGVQTKSDHSHGMVRTEVTCASCDAHLGHVFPDGPGPGGNRFCINSASLRLQTRNGSDD